MTHEAHNGHVEGGHNMEKCMIPPGALQMHMSHSIDIHITSHVPQSSTDYAAVLSACPVLSYATSSG